MPFTEYQPGRSLFKFVYDWFDSKPTGYRAGSGDRTELTVNNLHVLTSICFDIAYPFSRADMLSADFLIEASNNAWFDDTQGAHQFVQMARLRAMEMGRPLLRSTNTGLSAVINEQGRIVATLPPHEAGALSTQLTVFKQHTPFAMMGSNGIIIFIMVLTLTFSFLKRSTKRSHMLLTQKKQ